jgi:hypothetical protein
MCFACSAFLISRPIVYPIRCILNERLPTDKECGRRFGIFISGYRIS